MRHTPPTRRRRPRVALTALLAATTLSVGVFATHTLGTSSATAATVITAAATSTATTTAATAFSATQGAVAPNEDASDYTWNESSVVTVKLADNATTVTGSGVKVSGNTVTITAAGTYRVSGKLSNGQLVVDAKDALVRILLDGASVTSSTSSAVNVVKADKVVVLLTKGTTSNLTDASTYTYATGEDEPDAALFSKADLTIAGEGTLNVTGRAGDAVASKDGLLLAGGTINVTAADDGIRAKDYLIVKAGTVNVTATGDGLKATEAETANAGYVSVSGATIALKVGTDGIDAAQNATITGGTLTIAADDDGIHADAKLDIRGGTINITKSYEGIESKVLTVTGGTVTIVSSDDGVNGSDGSGASEQGFGGPGGNRGGGAATAANNGVTFSMTGGTIAITADGDGFDVNGDASISGGTLVVNGPTTNGNGALDVDGSFEVSGGVIVAAGSAGMAVAPSTSSAQVSLSLIFDSTQPAGTVIQIRDSAGKVVGTFQSSRSFQSLVFSSSALKAGASYSVYSGGKPSGTSLGGYFAKSSATAGTSVGTITA